MPIESARFVRLTKRFNAASFPAHTRGEIHLVQPTGLSTNARVGRATAKQTRSIWAVSSVSVVATARQVPRGLSLLRVTALAGYVPQNLQPLINLLPPKPSTLAIFFDIFFWRMVGRQAKESKQPTLSTPEGWKNAG